MKNCDTHTWQSWWCKMQYITGHLGISQRGCKNNRLLLYFTSKLSRLCLASHPIASCVLGVSKFSLWDLGEDKTARASLSCSLCETARLMIFFVLFWTGNKERKHHLSLQFWCHVVFVGLWNSGIWMRKKAQKKNYIQRKTALEIYIQSAKCQAGLSALKQSFLS